MDTWDGYTRLFPISERLQGAPANISGSFPDVKMHKFWVQTIEPRREVFIKRLAKALQNKAGDECIDELCHSLNESLMNVSEYVHNFSQSKKALVHLYEITAPSGSTLGYTIQHEETPLDISRIRTSTINPDGSLYFGSRGRGHILMNLYSDNCAYPLFSKPDGYRVSELHGAKALR